MKESGMNVNGMTTTLNDEYNEIFEVFNKVVESNSKFKKKKDILLSNLYFYLIANEKSKNNKIKRLLDEKKMYGHLINELTKERTNKIYKGNFDYYYRFKKLEKMSIEYKTPLIIDNAWKFYFYCEGEYGIGEIVRLINDYHEEISLDTMLDLNLI